MSFCLLVAGNIYSRATAKSGNGTREGVARYQHRPSGRSLAVPDTPQTPLNALLRALAAIALTEHLKQKDGMNNRFV